MRQLIGTVPLLGALLLSTAPVQAFQTFEVIVKICEASEKIGKACLGSGIYFSAITTYELLCLLREEGDITREAFSKASRNMEMANKNPFEKVSWNAGIKDIQEQFPNCPISPLP